MVAGHDRCVALSGSSVGLDQGVHNAMMRVHLPGQWADYLLRAPEAADLMAEIRAFHSRTTIVVEKAEGDLICTIGLPAARGRPIPLDGEGYFTTLGGGDARCALVHQYDRSPYLDAFYTAKFDNETALPRRLNAAAVPGGADAGCC